jgi:hypothetical protein
MRAKRNDGAGWFLHPRQPLWCCSRSCCWLSCFARLDSLGAAWSCWNVLVLTDKLCKPAIVRALFSHLAIMHLSSAWGLILSVSHLVL